MISPFSVPDSSSEKKKEKFEAGSVPPGMDEVQLGQEVLHLPSEFCSNPEVLREFFSPETWQSLDETFRDRLMVCKLTFINNI